MERKKKIGGSKPAEELLRDQKEELEAANEELRISEEELVSQMEELQQSRDALRLKNFVFDASIAANSIADTNGVITEANAAFLKVWGYPSKEEVLGRPIPDFLQNQDEVAAILAALSTTGDWEGDYTAKRKDGTTFVAHGLATAVRDEGGKVIGYQSAVLDVTVSKRAEKELDRLFNVSVDMIAIAGFDGYWKRVNPAWERALGHSTDHILSKPFVEFVHPEDREATIAEAGKIAQGVETLHFENRYRCKDGSYRWLAWTAIPVVDEGLMYCVARDITESKRAEEALRESEMELQTAQRIARMGSWRLESATNHVVWTEGLYRMLGLSPSLPPPDYTEHQRLFTPESWDRLSIALSRTQEAGVPYELELEMVRPGENNGWMLAFGEPVRDASGAIVGLRGAAQDITERKRAEETLRKAMADLKRSNEELQQFAYVASHDLQEPLRAVASFTQLLSERYKGRLDADADEFIAFAVGGANRMQTLINDLLSYSRLETRGKPPEPVDSHDALGQALANLGTAIRESVALVTNDDLPKVLADESQLVQLFQNLVGNAIKFRGKEPPRVHVSAVSKGNEWLFSVRDNGIGIAQEYHERIFSIFQRLHSREDYPGTGIGLALCKRIVERHGGTIRVESEPGSGSTFFFTLPKT